MNIFIDDGGGSPSFSFSGALVRLSADQTPSTVFTWDTEVYDTSAWHDLSSQTDRMTVPSGVSIARLTNNIKGDTSGSAVEAKQKLGGSDFNGQGYHATESSGLGARANCVSAPIAVSSGNYFTLDNPISGVTDATEETWLAVEAIDPATKYALVRKNATQSVSSAVETTLTWQTEVADVGGWFDAGSNNTLFTVPSGTSGYARLCVNTETNSVTGQAVVEMFTGGDGIFVGAGWKDTQRSGTDPLNAVSAVIAVSAGDTFKIKYNPESSATMQNASSVWFSIEEVRNFAGCLAYKSGSQALSAGVETAVALASESYDTHNAHDNASNNSRITVPSGFTRARPSFGLLGPSVTGYELARVLKNGSAYHGMPSQSSTTTGAELCNALGAWVDVVPGDYFELYATLSAGGTLPVDNRSWLCVEFQ